jgi:hypothetical protein
MVRTNDNTSEPASPRRSASAEAAALRYWLLDEAAAFQPLPPFAAGGGASPTRPCAHAEAAALRWLEQLPD